MFLHPVAAREDVSQDKRLTDVPLAIKYQNKLIQKKYEIRICLYYGSQKYFSFTQVRLFIFLRALMGVACGGTWPAMHVLTARFSL